MRAVLPRRTTVAGDPLDLLVLARSGGELIGVDLASGAFVRAPDPGGAPARPLDVVRSAVAEGEPLWSPHAPEQMALAEPVRRVGRVTGRRAERVLRPLLDPRGDQLLGFAGPSIPYWTLTGDRPSLAILQPTRGPVIRVRPEGVRCRFRWRDRDHDLPVADERVLAVLDRDGAWRSAGPALAHALGYRPGRVLVALSPPWRGHCYKFAVGLLPG